MLNFIYTTFESFITDNIPEVKNFSLYEEDEDDLNKDPITNPSIEFEILDFKPINFGNNYQQWVGEIKLHINVDVYNDIRTNSKLKTKSLDYFNIMNNIYKTLNGLDSYDLPDELKNEDYQINDIIRSNIHYAKNVGNVKTAEIIFQIVVEDYSNVPEEEIITIEEIDTGLKLRASSSDLYMTVNQLTTSTAYTYYDIQVKAFGGSAPYTGTGTFSKQYGTYTFTVTDANGDSVSEDFKVEAPIRDSGLLVQAVYKKNKGVIENKAIFYPYNDPNTHDLYVNWGDGTDDIIQNPQNKQIYHTYPSVGFYQAYHVDLEENTNTTVAGTGIYFRESSVDINKWFSFDDIIMTDSNQKNWYSYYRCGQYGDIVAFKKDYKVGDLEVLLNSYHYNIYTDYTYGDIANLKFYKLSIFGVDQILTFEGDIVELINQQGVDNGNYQHNIYVNLFQTSGYICSDIDVSYTDSKSIQYFRVQRMQDTYLGGGYGVYAENVLKQVSQNQTYVGGTLKIETSDNLDYSKPEVLSAYNNLFSLGWSFTLPNYPP